MRLDVGEMVKGIQQRIPFLGAPERLISELVDMLRDAHRIMLRLEETMDRFDKMSQSWDDRIANFELSPERAAEIVRQSSSARWVGFLATLIVVAGRPSV